MKLTNLQNRKAKSGMTLLELTVVILVLLSLISILFIGARAWKKGSDRAGCILNIRNVQQAVRGHANMHELAIAATITPATDIYGTTGYMKTPACPALGTYTTGTAVPAIGSLFITCSLAATETHVPAAYTDW